MSPQTCRGTRVHQSTARARWLHQVPRSRRDRPYDRRERASVPRVGHFHFDTEHWIDFSVPPNSPCPRDTADLERVVSRHNRLVQRIVEGRWRPAATEHAHDVDAASRLGDDAKLPGARQYLRRCRVRLDGEIDVLQPRAQGEHGRLGRVPPPSGPLRLKAVTSGAHEEGSSAPIE